MNHAPHILIVDDDAEIRQLLGDYLRKNGLRASAVGDGAAMRALLAREPVDLIVLDLMLPGEDGLTLCRTLRAQSTVPVIMLTAKGDETDRIVGLEMGADDYLPKPFNPRELLARIKTVLRRTSTAETARGEPKRLRFAGWVLDLTARHLLDPQGVIVPLSSSEYRLLRIFLAHPQRVLSRDQLLDLTQGREAGPFDRSIDVQVSRLRQRLCELAREPIIIKTVRNEGYVLASAVEAEY
jgi:two-component system OmpR family response regulator